MPPLPIAGFLLVAFTVLFANCGGVEVNRYYITPDHETNCDHEPCLTLDQFAFNSVSINETVTLFLIPGHHNLTRSIEIVGADHFAILASTIVRIQCTSPASFLFEGISILEISNTAIVSCGGGGSSGVLQVRSVQQFKIRNVTLQESASVSLDVQDSNGLVTGARFIGNTGAGMNIATSTIVFEGNNTFSDNLDGGIASYNSTLQFSGVNQFTNNTATNGGGISAISSTINCSGSMTFENNSAMYHGGSTGLGGGLFAGDNSEVDFNGSTVSFINNGFVVGDILYYYLPHCVSGGGIYTTTSSTVYINGNSNFVSNSAMCGGGVGAFMNATVDISGATNFINNSAQRGGGGVYARDDAIVYISGINNFRNNAAQFGGGILAVDATVYINGISCFMNNTAQDNGGGVYAYIYATVDINGTTNFISNSAQQYGGGVYADGLATVDINGTTNLINNSAQYSGGGVFVYTYATVDITGTTNFINNSARWGGGVYAANSFGVDITGTANFISNSAQCGGGIYARHAAVDISGITNFKNNSAQWNGGAIFANDNVSLVISGNSIFTRNSASVRGGGVYVDTSSVAHFNKHILFSDNWSQYGGGISIKQSEIVIEGEAEFSNNTASYGGAIQAFEANINITGNGSFIKNLATVNGGAIALAGGSVVYIFETASLTYSQNTAYSFGGAIYIEDYSVHCSYNWNINGFLGISPNENSYLCSYGVSFCLNFYFASFQDKINITFSGNSAVAGSVIFGGEIDETISNIKFSMDYPTISELFQYLINVNIDDTNNGSIISSNPNHICRCINSQPDCSDSPSPYEVSVYPGQTVGVSLVAVGQRKGTVPSTTTAIYNSDGGATFRDLQATQRIDHTTCTELNYTIFSTKGTEAFKIYVDGSCGLEGIPLSVSVKLLECPIGFTLSNSSEQCVCEERLKKHTNSCNIDNLEITRTASDSFWVGVTNGTEGLILHPHCPFDYCTTDTVHFTLVEGSDIPVTNHHNPSLKSTMNDTMNETEATDYAIGNSIETQCNYNRSGLLCGKCQKGFSLVFGSSKCLKCSNSYLSLLIAFALAGVILVIFLFILKLTVAVGTINGIILYANIVSVNRAQLFPSGETNILTVFIAWVNLDFGIETCFFDGMDAYSKAWLQYAFPIYMWVLVGSIILASHHSTRIARSLGSNPVAVLATLFLLSYAKLLLSIINPLFVTLLEYPSYSKAVWLVDGNVPYLKGKHLPLFLTSLLALFLLFIPFTLLLLLGQWIQAQSGRKCCSWISDYRISTFLDVYHGPFKSKHRYWCGLLLVTRICLFLVFTFNVNGDPSVNILAIAVCLIGLQAMFFWFKVYKVWYLNVLEASFIMNLLVLAIGTYFVEISGGNQNALTYTSVSVAFATFCGIVVYHSYLQVKVSNLFKKLYKKFIHSLKPSADDNGAGDIEMKIEEDPPRKYTKPPTTMVVELTH